MHQRAVLWAAESTLLFYLQYTHTISRTTIALCKTQSKMDLIGLVDVDPGGEGLDELGEVDTPIGIPVLRGKDGEGKEAEAGQGVTGEVSPYHSIAAH
jgi:hypothetical protein